MIEVKRAYEAASAADGHRVLVDRVWPRGLRKERAAVKEWAKDVAPSTQLRQWFGHDPSKWREFQRRYWEELDAAPDAWRPLAAAAAREAKVTLVYAAKDEEHNNAVALREYLLRHAGQAQQAQQGAARQARQAQRGGAAAERGAKRKAAHPREGGGGTGGSKKRKASGGGQRQVKPEE